MFKWNTWETCNYVIGDVKTNNIAAFDFDGTIVKAKYGKKYSTTASGYDFNMDPEKINECNKLGWTVVIFSNRKNIGYEGLNFLTNLKFTPWIFTAMSDDKYRKPDIGMWNLFIYLLSERGITNISSDSFYMGDAAAGFTTDPKYIWSDSDYKFALNIGIQFILPVIKL